MKLQFIFRLVADGDARMCVNVDVIHRHIFHAAFFFLLLLLRFDIKIEIKFPTNFPYGKLFDVSLVAIHRRRSVFSANNQAMRRGEKKRVDTLTVEKVYRDLIDG